VGGPLIYLAGFPGSCLFPSGREEIELRTAFFDKSGAPVSGRADYHEFKKRAEKGKSSNSP